MVSGNVPDSAQNPGPGSGHKKRKKNADVLDIDLINLRTAAQNVNIIDALLGSVGKQEEIILPRRMKTSKACAMGIIKKKTNEIRTYADYASDIVPASKYIALENIAYCD